MPSPLGHQADTASPDHCPQMYFLHKLKWRQRRVHFPSLSWSVHSFSACCLLLRLWLLLLGITVFLSFPSVLIWFLFTLERGLMEVNVGQKYFTWHHVYCSSITKRGWRLSNYLQHFLRRHILWHQALVRHESLEENLNVLCNDFLSFGFDCVFVTL